MLEKIKNFFEEDKLFFVSTIVATVGFIISTVCCFALLFNSTYMTYYLYTALLFLLAIVSGCSYLTYVKHNKNVMKGLLPMLFTLQFMMDLVAFVDGFIMQDTIQWIISACNGVIDIAIIVVHFALGSDHHSSPALIIALASLLCACALLSIASLFPLIFLSGSIAIGLAALASTASYVALAFEFLCIEIRVDNFRAKRDESKEKQEFDSKMW